MRIGIDIDNTITDTLPVLKQYCKKYNDEVVKRNLPMNEKGFATTNLYDWTEEEEGGFCRKYLEEAVMKATIKQNADKIIRKLKEEGNTIYIITARLKHHFREPYKITEKFLRENGIVYDELMVGITNKKQCCIDKNIDIMLDDEPQNISTISQTIPVIVFEAIHNEECNGNNIIKVKNWNEAYEIIKEIEKGGK